MSLSLVVPAMAKEVDLAKHVYETTEQDVMPLTEMTEIFWRTYHGQLQFRVWSLTNGRWITDWVNFG